MQLKYQNMSLIETIEQDLPESTFYWLMISVCASIAWIVYLTYYNSRVLGLMLTAVLNRFVKNGHLKIGSFSVSLLSGKIMFRDVHYITEDYSVRILLGFAIFRWWRPLTHKEITEDLSHSETRLTIYLDSFEWHVYGRADTYARLERLFGLNIDHHGQEDNRDDLIAKKEEKPMAEGKWQWRDLIPLIKCDVNSGRLVFGNYLLPTTLSINFADTHFVYTTKSASTPFDQFMHVLKVKADMLRVMLVPSPKFRGRVDEPPRFMGEGFVVLKSSNVELYYYHDEAGLVPYEPEVVQLVDGKEEVRKTWPCWGMDVKCGHGTDISYGPWADRQREHLWKFFFPADYQPQKTSVLPQAGQLRKHKNFDFKLSMQASCTFDVLFTKNKETQALHMNAGAGSYLEFTVPSLIGETGFTTRVTAQLMNVDATTSLQFRSFVECETLAMDLVIKYPKLWNAHQHWQIDVTACKASIQFISLHRLFFVALVEEWSDKSRADLLRFIPYTINFSLVLNEFELITFVNQHNWLDCFGQTPENAQIAVCGNTLDMTLELPFFDFLPPKVLVEVFVQAKVATGRLFLPETNPSRRVLVSIASTLKMANRDGSMLGNHFETFSEANWRRHTDHSVGWVDMVSTSMVTIAAHYCYHPRPNTEDHSASIDESDPPSCDPSLIPIMGLPPTAARPPRPTGHKRSASQHEFDPGIMEADHLKIEIELEPAKLCAYGSLLTNILHLKENYFGEDMTFTNYESPGIQTSIFDSVLSLCSDKLFDATRYRPMDVTVQVTLPDIQAHLVKNCSANDPVCPWLSIGCIAVEVIKNFNELTMQVLVSESYLFAVDHTERPETEKKLNQGQLALSGLQVRGHALYSHQGLAPGSDSLEYAWMLEVTIGDLIGELTLPQLHMVLESLQTCLFLLEDNEHALQNPRPQQMCVHLCPPHKCTAMSQTLLATCPPPAKLTYRMTRVSIDAIDINLVEAGVSLNIQLLPIRLGTCNLHSETNRAGLTLMLPRIRCRQLILSTPVTSHHLNPLVWVEAGSVSLGPVNVDSAHALTLPELRQLQREFLETHDARWRHLHFLWSDGSVPCGCQGGCDYFGDVPNGARLFDPGAAMKRFGYGSYGASLLRQGEQVLPQPTGPYLSTLQHQAVPADHSYFSDASSDSTSEHNYRPESETAVEPAKSATDNLGGARPEHEIQSASYPQLNPTPLVTLEADISEMVENRYHPSSPVVLRTARVASPVTSSLSSVVASEDFYSASENNLDATSRTLVPDNVNDTLVPGDDDQSTSSFESAFSSISDAYPTHSLPSSQPSLRSYHRHSASNLVDLHSHISHKITESPVLMGCYLQHLSQYQLSSSSPFMSRFSELRSGFSPHFITRRRCVQSPPNLSGPSTCESGSQRFFPSTPTAASAASEVKYKQPCVNTPIKDPLASSDDTVDKTTAFVKLVGTVSILVTPLMLEALQRYIEALTPVLESLHVSTVIDKLHIKCTDIVKSQNPLIQSETTSACDSTAHHMSRLQIMFSLPEVNVCLLQASLVEELVTFSALDRVSELTSVAVLSVCFDNIVCMLLLNQNAYREDNDVAGLEGGREKQRQDAIGHLQVSRLHTQLRRLKHRCHYSPQVVLTAIPEHRAKAFFTFASPSPYLKPSKVQHERLKVERVAGFIICECGLEKVAVKLMQRRGYTSEEKSDAGSHAGTASDDSTSWHSRISHGSAGPPQPETESLKGDASSGVLELQTVWFNFAAPPPTPKDKRLEYNRYDWNLLSTATVSVNAWLSPTERFVQALQHLIAKYTYRVNAALACMMTEALDMQNIYMPPKATHVRLTCLSKAIQADPSCRLLSVLRRYIACAGIDSIERSVTADTAPCFATLQRGLRALTRQWKTILCVPPASVPGHPFPVTLHVPPSRSELASHDDASQADIQDNYEVVDEKVTLLKPDESSRHRLTSGETAGRSSDHPESACSQSQSSDDIALSGLVKCEEEDLYRWMQRQQEYTTRKEENLKSYPSIGLESLNMARVSDMSQEDVQPVATVTSSPFQLANAQELFKPLLDALGLHLDAAVQTSLLMKKFGGNVSLQCQLQSLRVDIVHSDVQRLSARWRSKATKSPTAAAGTSGKKHPSPLSRFQIDTGFEKPALLCETFSILASMTDVVHEKSQDEATIIGKPRNSKVMTVDYVDAAHSTTTHLNVNVACTAVSQHVNMPLLRLAHQVLSMVQNVSTQRAPVQQPQSPGFSHDIGFEPPAKRPRVLTLATNTFPADEMSSPALMEKTILTEITESTPACWCTMYRLLNLYLSVPAEGQQRGSLSKLSVIAEESDSGCRTVPVTTQNLGTTVPRSTTFKQNIFVGERIPLVVFAVAKVKRIQVSAMLSGLKLEAEMQNTHASVTHKERVRGVMKRKSRESSATAHVGHTMIALLEGIDPSMQTVVTANVGKSSCLYSSLCKRGREQNSCLMTLGFVGVDIPQHPVALHGVVQRSSKRITSTIQEFIGGATRSQDSFDVDAGGVATSHHSRLADYSIASVAPLVPLREKTHTRLPMVVYIRAVLKGLSFTASLLPSLRAQYKMDEVRARGLTGKKARCTVDLPRHSLSFTTKVNTKLNLPSSASIALPPIHVSLNYELSDEEASSSGRASACRRCGVTDGLTLRQGDYLSVVADVGLFEHCLSTDLLNHLVFMQNVFLKEVNEIIQKMSGGHSDLEEGMNAPAIVISSSHKPLYSIHLHLKGIQITATTPTNSAVRLETGAVDLEITNRMKSEVQQTIIAGHPPANDTMKLFVKMHLDLNIALGSLIKHPMFEEAESEFQQLASFATGFTLRNALEEELISDTRNQEVLLISLNRPIIFVQTAAFDKAVLIWLNYKNAYEYWNEQRLVLVTDDRSRLSSGSKVDMTSPTAAASSSSSTITPTALSDLFLQLTVNDLGVCVPMASSQGLPLSRVVEECGAAMVMTLESTQISAFSQHSLVSRGTFNGFCLRFADDFDVGWDDWKPDNRCDVVMNAMVVPEGSYDVCSRTIDTTTPRMGNVSWILNVNWKMKGLDVNLDTNIGRRLSMLGATLTFLGEEDTAADSPVDGVGSPPAKVPSISGSESGIDDLPPALFDTTLSSKERMKLAEKEMTRQARVVENLLRKSGSGTLAVEQRRLADLETIVFHGLKGDILKRLRRGTKGGQTMTWARDKLLQARGAHHIRSHSIDMPASVESMTPTHSRAFSDYIGSQTRLHRVSFGGVDIHSSHLTSGSVKSSHDIEMPTFNYVSANEDRAKKEQAEPNIDFELDIKVDIDSGQCVLHPKEAKSEYENEMKTGFLRKKESPKMEKKLKSNKKSSVDIMGGRGHQPTVENKIVCMLPGVDVKVHYSSKNNAVSTDTDSAVDGATSAVMKKTANLYIWLTMQPLSEEMLISPVLLDFLEQALDPIPLDTTPQRQQPSNKSDAANKEDDGTTTTSAPLASNPAAYGSFAVDIVFCLRMQSSLVRFTCLPASRVQCLLRLPSLDLVFSTMRTDSSMRIPQGDPSPGSSQRHQSGDSSQQWDGGLGVTGCLTDFSLFIFHPYGGGVQRLYPSHVEKRSKSPRAVHDEAAEDLQRKDALSLNLAFIKVNVSRSRRAINQSTSAECLQSMRGSSVSVAVDPRHRTAYKVDFSAVCHIGSASFKYDMRRLSEILMFPKAWYRRSLARRLFLGEQGEQTASATDETSSSEEEIAAGLFNSGSNQVLPMSSSQLENAPPPPRPRPMTHQRSTSQPTKEFAKSPLPPPSPAKVRGQRTETPTGGVANRSPGQKSNRPSSQEVKAPIASRPTQLIPSIPPVPRSPATRPSTAKQAERETLPSGTQVTGDKPFVREAVERHFISSVSTSEASSLSSSDTAAGSRRQSVPFTQLTTHTASTQPEVIPTDTSRHTGPVAAAGPMPPIAPQSAHPISAGAQPPLTLNTGLTPTRPMTGWQTLVIFAVNAPRLDVSVNMSNVMGNTVLTVQKSQCQGQLSITSAGHRNMGISVGLGKSKLEARGGIVGGHIDLTALKSCIFLKEEPGEEPDHQVELALGIMETRLDYMGSSVLMARICHVNMHLRDEWKVNESCSGAISPDPLSVATKRPMLIFVHGQLAWNKLHFMISRSTTPDLMKMVAKISEFFGQQFSSSRRAIVGLKTDSRVRLHKKSHDEASWISEVKHHRHWQKVLSHISGCKFPLLGCDLPERGTIAGGTMGLRGHNLTLACFHGINFRSKSWALFILDDPTISFQTEAQGVHEQGCPSMSTHIVQNMSFQLGRQSADASQRNNMASVFKLSRGVPMPPPMTSINEWFHYAFATNEIKELDSFPHMSDGNETLEKRVSRHTLDYKHETEIIFVLPALQMDLKTEHLQAATEPDENDPKPVIECSFVTEFEEHIYVTMDVEVILFLHDLIINYVKEKDKGSKTETEKKPTAPDPTAVLKLDFREFHCQTWHLEPKVRLLSWAGKRIDPVGVDYILQKLGFQHARLTIPKWLQRGCMDPLDGILSILVHRLVLALLDETPAETDPPPSD